MICKAFVDAVKSGDAEKFNFESMRNKVEVRDVIDAQTFNQNLCFTAVQGSDEIKCLDMLKFLVSLGVDLNAKDNLKQTPLFYAAKQGHCSIIKVLIENGLDINQIDFYGQNAIYYAINTGKFDAVKLIQHLGSEVDHIDDNK